MNADNMRTVANAIANNSDLYDQRCFGDPHLDADGEFCGGAGCIAGWAVALFPDVREADGLWHHSSQFRIAKEVLGLTENESVCLFAQEWPDQWLEHCDGPPRDKLHYWAAFMPTAAQAASIMRKFAAFGRVPLATVERRPM